jgi:phosphoglucosamine mutase
LGSICLYLKENKKLSKNAMVSTVMSNQGLEDFLKLNKIKLFKSTVGDKNVLEIMKKENINFGGEESGHIILSDFAKTGDGIVAALQVLSILLIKKEPISKILRPFELYPQILENLDVNSKPPLNEIKGLNKKIKSLEDKNIQHLIRYSGTEKKLRILLEGKDLEHLQIEMKKLINFFKENI